MIIKCPPVRTLGAIMAPRGSPRALQRTVDAPVATTTASKVLGHGSLVSTSACPIYIFDEDSACGNSFELVLGSRSAILGVTNNARFFPCWLCMRTLTIECFICQG